MAEVVLPCSEEILKAFVIQARKTIECALCHEILNDPLVSMPCEHPFCRGCVTMKPEGGLLCPICKSPVAEKTLVQSEKLDKLARLIRQFISDFCDDSGCAKENFLGKPKCDGQRKVLMPEVPSEKESENQDCSQLGRVQMNTQEPREKVNEWLANVDATPITVDISEDEKLPKSKTRKNPSPTGSNGRSTRSSSRSSPPEIDPFLELRSSRATPPNKRGRGGKRGRPARKNALPLRSAEKAASVGHCESPPSPKQLFKSQPVSRFSLAERNLADEGTARPRSPVVSEAEAVVIEKESHSFKGSSGNVISEKALDNAPETAHPSSALSAKSASIPSAKEAAIHNDVSEMTRPSSRRSDNCYRMSCETGKAESLKPSTTPTTLDPSRDLLVSSHQISALQEKAEELEVDPVGSRSDTTEKLSVNHSTIESGSYEECLMVNAPPEVGPFVPNTLVIEGPSAVTVESKEEAGQNALEILPFRSPGKVMNVGTHVVDDEMAEIPVRPESRNRLTFAIPTETQDLLELDQPHMKTQDLLATVMEKEAESIQRPIVFRLKGHLVPKKPVQLGRNPVVFKLLGRLDPSGKGKLTTCTSELGDTTMSDSGIGLVVTPLRPPVSTCARWTQTEPLPTLISVDTQTVPASIISHSHIHEAPRNILASTETQTSPIQIAETPAGTPLVEVGTVPESNANSNTVCRPPSVVQVESEDSNGMEIFSAQTSKRARQLSSSSDTEDSQDAKRRRSTPTKSIATVQPIDRGQPTAKDSFPPDLLSTPTTRVMESDTEDTEDMLRATPRRKPERKRMSIQRKVFVCSGLPRSQVKIVEELARQLNAEVLPTYTHTVTHVIVRVDEDNIAERTLKFLYGVAAKKWVVSVDWIRHCAKENRFVDEEAFEVLDMEGENGPNRARVSQTRLFDGFEFCCVEPFTDVTVEQLRELLQLCGAATVPTPFDLSRRHRCSMVIVQTDEGFDLRKAELWADQYQVPTVSREWVLDCVASYNLYPVRGHLIGRKSESVLKKMAMATKLLS